MNLKEINFQTLCYKTCSENIDKKQHILHKITIKGNLNFEFDNKKYDKVYLLAKLKSVNSHDILKFII